ncbi:hypothetical protein BN874_80082 [Candidatus Contendobacter odensis Run_B_J11]|uniref:Uncharacterized protein n=1 Tax=Candidatus Contendobacter odensis Run_B_J11 TaxID=1400861 RepID=A0A7U7J5J4_9GAMM|nr:hypothetical protein BN874_80082 [Candidatus Contendobacter odensis Run_B_J11]
MCSPAQAVRKQRESGRLTGAAVADNGVRPCHLDARFGRPFYQPHFLPILPLSQSLKLR